VPGCAHYAAGDPRDGLAQIRDAFGDGQANSVADDDGESDPVAERGGHVRALVNEVPLSIDTPVNDRVRPRVTLTLSYLVASACAAPGSGCNLELAELFGVGRSTVYRTIGRMRPKRPQPERPFALLAHPQG
jgi:hypothetical protein